MYHIYSQDIYHLLALLLSLWTYVPHLLTRHLPSTGSVLSLRTYVPYLLTRHLPSTGWTGPVSRRMYHIYSQDIYHPLALLLSLRDVCTISTHKTIYHLLALVLSLRTYVPHLLTRHLPSRSWYCPWTYVPHLLTRHLPSTGSVLSL